MSMENQKKYDREFKINAINLSFGFDATDALRDK